MREQLNILIEEELIKEIKHLAIDRNVSVSDIIEKLIEKEVSKK